MVFVSTAQRERCPSNKSFTIRGEVFKAFLAQGKVTITEQIAIWTNTILTLCSSILSSFATKWQQITVMQSHNNDVLNTVEEYFYLRFMLLHYLIASLKLINQYRLLQFSNPHLENLIKYCLYFCKVNFLNSRASSQHFVLLKTFKIMFSWV